MAMLPVIANTMATTASIFTMRSTATARRLSITFRAPPAGEKHLTVAQLHFGSRKCKTMKSKPLLGLALGLSGVLFVSIASAQTTGQIFCDSKYGFQLTLPPGWQAR